MPNRSAIAASSGARLAEKQEAQLASTGVRWPSALLMPAGLREVEMSGAASHPWPTELRLRKDRQALAVVFDSGDSFELSAEYLRVKSPSAEVQGHSPDERKTVAGKRNVEILEIIPIGNYAVRLVFDDLHSTGIYSWDYLFALGRNRDAYWQEYLDDLAGKGLAR
jgi:DUF971 family protein